MIKLIIRNHPECIISKLLRQFLKYSIDLETLILFLKSQTTSIISIDALGNT